MQEYGNSYSFRNLKYMSQFAKEFNESEIRHQLGAQFSLRTLIEIMSKSKSHEEIIQQPVGEIPWRTLIEPNTTSIIKTDNLTKELFKDTYV